MKRRPDLPSATIKTLLTAVVVAAALSPLGCSAGPGTLDRQKYVWASEGLTLNLPTGDWSVEEAFDRGIVVLSRAGESERLAVQVTTDKRERPLAEPVLARLLFVEFEEKEIVAAARTPLGGPGGPEMECLTARAKEDGKEVMIEACVLPRGDKVYDFVCWSAPKDFERVKRLFREFLTGVLIDGERQ